ncbi:hypothetical protein [Pseudomonas putida]
MALSFDDLPDEAPQAKPAASSAQGGLSFDDLPDEAQAKPVPAAQPTGIAGLLAGLNSGNLNDLMPESWQPALRGLDDYGLSLSKGMIGAGEGVVGLGDIATGGRVTPGLKAAYGYDPAARRQALDAMATPQHQQAMQQLDRAQGLGGTLQALRDNPSLVPHAIVESLPSMALGGVAGRGAAAGARGLGASGGLAGLLGTASGEGLVASGQQASQITQQTGGLTPKQAALAVGTGAATGMLGAAGAKVGRSLGIGDVDAMLAGQNGGAIARNLVQRILGGTTLESLEEAGQSTSEQVLGNIALGKDPFDGVAKAATMGGVTGGLMGGGANLLARPSTNTPQPEQSVVAPVAPQVDSRIEAARQNVHSAAQQPAPVQAPQPLPFAGSSDISPLLDNLGVQGEKRTQSLDLLRPAEQDIEARRRGVVTLDEQRRLANLIGLDGAKAQAFSRQIGQAWSAEQTMAATDLVSSRLQSVLEQQQKVAGGQATDADRANFVDSVSELQGVFAELMGARAEAGRALAAHRRVTTDAKQVKAILDSIGGVEGADALATALGEAVRVGGVQNASRLMAKGPGALNKWLGQYWRSALLTGAGTHAINAVSNTGMLVNELFERGIAAGIGATKRAFTGGKSGQTVFKEPAALMLGYAQNMTKAMGAAGQVWKTGRSDAIDGSNTELYGHHAVQTPIEIGGEMQRPHIGKLDTVMDLPFRALGTSDALFRTLNYAAEIRAQAHQIASAEKRAGTLPSGMKLSERVEQLTQTPTPAMIERADEHRAQQTFQLKVGMPTAMVNAAKARMPWLHAIMPCTTTPANILKEAWKRTPLAWTAPSVRRDLKAGGAAQERAIARMMAGTSVMALTSALTAAGYLTGSGPTDKKEKEALLASGWQPRSIKVGDNYYSYARFAPLSILLGMAADLTELWMYGGDKTTAGDYVLGGLSSFADNFVDQSYMRGISDLAQFASDPRRNGEWYAGRMLGSFGQPFTLASNFASAMDPYARDTKGITGPLRSRVPFLREGLPAKRDAFGQMIPNSMNQSGALSMLLPVSRTQQTDDPVRVEAGRLGWSPPTFQKELTLKGKKVAIPADQHEELVEIAGQLTHAGAKRLMRSPDWKNMDDDARKEALDDMAKKARTLVRMAAIPLVTSGKRSAIDKLRSSLEQRK